MRPSANIYAKFKNRLLSKRYNYINEPIPLKTSEYDKALEAFLDRFTKYHNVKSIYRFGFISSLGVSDLDFIVVLNDPLNKPREDLSYKGFTAKNKYIYNNTPPIYLSENLFQNFIYVLPLKGIELLYGKNIEQIAPENKEIYNLLTTIEICTLFYPRVFLDLLYASKFNVRRALCLINALQYPMKLIKEQVREDGRWQKFEKDVKDLRENWFQVNSDSHKQLIRLVIEAVYISMDLIEKTADYLVASSYVKNCNLNQALMVGQFRCNFYIFSTDFRKEEALQMILRKYEKSCRPKRFISVLPSPFLAPLLAYKEQNGLLSNHLKLNLKVNDSFNPEFALKEEAHKRINVLNSLMSFLENNKITPNGAHIYYDYWPKTGLRNRLVHYSLKLGLL